MTVKLWFDGGCRPNPGPMETAVAVRGQVRHRQLAGQGDNTDAEWLALLDALDVARELGLTDITLLGDCAVVVNQARGAAKCRDARFVDYLARFHALSAGFARVRVRYVPRRHNLAGIALEQARQGLGGSVSLRPVVR